MKTEKEIECDICKNVLDGSKIYEAGKTEAISNFAEKIKKLLNDWCYKDCMNSACQRDMFNKIDKLVKEQSIGDKK